MAITDRALVSIFENIGVSVEYTVLIVVFFAGLIFFATDFKLGLISNFVIFSLIFLWFYKLGLNYIPFLVLSFIFLIIASLCFLLIEKASKEGGIML